MRTIIFKLFAAAILLAGTSSCKEEGCTDEKALNYSVVAKKDDGSCVYCTETQNNKPQFSELIYDNNYYTQGGQTNPYYNQNVVEAQYTQGAIQFNSKDCGKSKCFLNCKLKNLTNKKLNFTINLSTSFSNTVQKTVELQPNQTLDVGEIVQSNSLCQFDLTTSETSAYINGPISYQ